MPTDFIETPLQNHPPHVPRFASDEIQWITVEVQTMLDKGAIEKTAQSPDQFVDHIFLRPKKNGTFRPVFNLKPLNRFIRYEHFKMEGMQMLSSMLQNGDWMCTLDLKYAYFCVAVGQNHQKYLRFLWNNQMYQYKSIPFGLGSAPRTFTKLLKLVVVLLRRLGIRLIIYLDDLIFFNQSRVSLEKDRDSAIWLLQQLGFVINWEKSNLMAQQCVVYLGFTMNSLAMTLALPPDRVHNIQQECQNIVEKLIYSVRALSRLIGKLTASVMAVLPAPLNYWCLQMQKTRALFRGGQNYNTMLKLTPECLEEIRWWLYYLKDWNGRAIITPAPDLIIMSDASMKGWGSVCNGVTTQGMWNNKERSRHINALELLAAMFAVKSFTKGRKKHSCTYEGGQQHHSSSNKQDGGTRSHVLILNMTKDLWQYSLLNGITLTAEHLPGVLNTTADRESRVFTDRSNWKLQTAMFDHIEKIFGEVQVDLFAERINAHKPKYVSWKPDPCVIAMDAFSPNWSQISAYAFPPFCLIGRCLAKIRKDQATVVIIAPVWPGQP